MPLLADSWFPPLLGLVLCGGESRRMGSDKGLLLKDDTPWVLHMGQKFHSFGIQVVYSINKRQQQTYSKHVPVEQLVVDALDLPGPLKGLFSVHKRFPDNDLLLIACDMIDLRHDTIGQLIDSRRTFPSHEFYVYGDAHRMQPFCAIYTAEGLSSAEQRGFFGNFSFQALLRRGYTKQLAHPPDETFSNYNTL